MVRFRLRTKVTLLTVLVIGVLLTVVMALTFTVSRNLLHENLNKNASAQVKIHSQYLANWLQTRLAEMEMMSFSSEIRSGDEEVIMAYLNNEIIRQDGIYLSFSIGDKDGYAYSDQRIYSNIRADEGFQKALQGEATISNPTASLENPNNLIVRFYIPIYQEAGQVSHVLLGESKINTVFKENTNFKLGNEDVVYLVNEDGIIIYHPEKNKILRYKLEQGLPEEARLMRQMKQKNEGFYESTFFSAVDHTKWYLVWDVPKSELTAALDDLQDLSITSMVIAVLSIGFFMFFILNNMFKRLQNVTEFTQQIADGNISVAAMSVGKEDEIGWLTASNNQMLASLQRLFGQLNEGVSRSANDVLSASQELSSSADETMISSKQIAGMMDEVAKESEKQTKTTEHNVALVEDMLEGIHHITDSATKVKNYAETTTKKAESGTNNMEKTKTQMERIQSAVVSSEPMIAALKTRSREIENIVDVINGLTNNINLLSLNASIEAARAGEHGRGFKVVADEVKKLALETSQSANQIAQLIGQTQQNVQDTEQMVQSIQSEVEEGTKVTTETAADFDDITASINQVMGQIVEVSAIAEALLSGSSQMLQTFKELEATSKINALHFQSVSSASEQQVSSMAHIADYAEHLSKMAQSLRELIQKVNL